jgi:type IV secretion system protein VirB11
MLSLFKDLEAGLTKLNAMESFRRLFIAALNKGVIPQWEDLFHELPTLESAEALQEIKDAFSALTDWPFLRDILELEGTEFYFHSPDKCQRQNLAGDKTNFKIELTEDDWQLWLEILSIKFKQNWNVQTPFASFYGELFGKRYRLSLIHGSTSPLGKSKLVLRSLAVKAFELSAFGKTEKLEELIKTKKNILIAGSTGSGKTSLLTSLLNKVESSEHLVILEDTYEIFSGHKHETRFLAGDTESTSLKAYLSYSLRLSPDRIILGEMRSHEVVPFVMAMNTGHKGLMGTLHASSAHDALNRVALLFS